MDGSELSECSLPHIKAIAGGCNVSEVILLRVIEPFHQTGWESYDSEEVTKMREATKLAIQEYLIKIADSLNSEGINARTVIIEGMPAHEILEYVSKNNIDLIIMSTHGSSGVIRWTMGSVTDKVLHHSQAPVLIIAPKACRN